MYSFDTYFYIIDLMEKQYQRFGGIILRDEYELLIDAAESGFDVFARTIRQMFYSRLDTALLGAIDSCLYFTEYAYIICYEPEVVFEGLCLLRDLVCRCCPSHTEIADAALEKVRLEAIEFFSSQH